MEIPKWQNFFIFRLSQPLPFVFPSPLLIINLEKLSPPVPFFLFLPSDRPGRKWGALITWGQIDFSLLLLLLLLESDCRRPANYSVFSGAEGRGEGRGRHTLKSVWRPHHLGLSLSRPKGGGGGGGESTNLSYLSERKEKEKP